MLFNYKALTDTGEKKEGVVEAMTKELAIGALQNRGLIITSVKAADEKRFSVVLFENIPVRDIVITSRQIATLFEAQVSALKAFSLLAGSTDNPLLRTKLTEVVDDLQAGFAISAALAKHPAVFSEFYVNMVHAGEESGKLSQTFMYLADYLERQYELTSKTKNALIYPAFVVVVFIAVIILMMVLVIPSLSQIILESGQEVPIYTRMVIAISNFFVHYGILVLIAFIVLGFVLWVRARTNAGAKYINGIVLSVPVLGELLRKVYLSRIADNMETMLSAGISIIRSIEITGSVVGSRVYQDVMKDVEQSVKGGSALSDALAAHPEIPPIMSQMIKVGEETGSMPSILKTLARFYKREVDDAVNTLVGLIEPVMIVGLGLGVGVLMASVLLPIYNIASSIQ